MKAGEFELDPAGITRVLAQPQAVQALRRRAEQVVTEARQAPHGEHAGEHEVEKISVGDEHVDASGAVIDIDWPSHVWHLVEFGSVNNPPYRPVTRAAQNAGLVVIDKRRS